MGVFNSINIYAHMNSSHGGMHGEELPPGLDVGGDPPGDFIAEQANALARFEMERRRLITELHAFYTRRLRQGT
jgi:hypothetical protein